MVWSLLNERSSTPFALSGATAISIPSGFWIHPPSSIQLKSDEALTPVVRAKAIWSADNRAYISIDLGGPVYKPLKTPDAYSPHQSQASWTHHLL
jgi:hypothetical protein